MLEHSRNEGLGNEDRNKKKYPLFGYPKVEKNNAMKV